MRMQMKSMLALIGFVWAVAQAANAQSVGSTSMRDGWVTVTPPEFHEIKTTFKDETTLRFSLPHAAKGTFDLANTRLKVVK